jgi:dTDP-4-amino-4,6-dideoxygalactose transaminase
MNFELVSKFEEEVAKFFGAPHAVAIDSCTHGIEICLRLLKINEINVPHRTYLSVPMLADKLNIKLNWVDNPWEDYYYLTNGEKKVLDAAVLWKENSYLPNTFMCLSFQYQKHLSLGRGGMILLDSKDDYIQLKKMSYDGRLPNIPWRDQNIETMGYHYYMTPETAQMGLEKLQKAISTEPKKWMYEDWPDLTKMKIFNNE